MKSKEKKNENFLLYIPKRKHEEFEERKGRVYLIFHHDKLANKIASKIFKKPRVTDIELDELGSEVWKLINGENTVYNIIENLKITFGDNCEQINDRLIIFIRYLNRRNWISFK